VNLCVYLLKFLSSTACVVREACRFVLEPTAECPRDICSMLSVSPDHGTLSPADRPTTIQVTFHSNREVTVRDQPILRCHVVEPTIGDCGETIASIPVKVTVRSTFTKSVLTFIVTWNLFCNAALIVCLYGKSPIICLSAWRSSLVYSHLSLYVETYQEIHSQKYINKYILIPSVL